jgi:phosphatidylserine decarboxylase
MDPFVVVTLGRKTYRTRVIRHNLNPVYDEKLVFQVAKRETSYSVGFSVVDRDQFSGNDYVGKVDLPLDKVISCAPEPDSETGLFKLPDGMITPSAESATESKKPRFRLPLSRSSSQQSLNKLARPPTNTQPPSSNLTVPTDDIVQPPAPTSAPSSGVNAHDLSKAMTADSSDNSFNPFVLPLDLKNKDRWGSKHNSTLYIRAKYLPYQALRQQFWRAMLRQYDADESARIDKVELTTMLDSLGSTLHESTIDGFFQRFPEEDPGELPSLSFDEAVICLEDELQRTSKKAMSLRPNLFSTLSSASFLTGDESGTATPSIAASLGGLSLQPTQGSTQSQTGEGSAEEQPNVSQNDLSNDLSDDRGEEHVIEIRECPICHQPRLNKRSDTDIVTHIATCASQDWRQVNNIVMAGFVTASQAQRKWYSKIVTKISYGGYRLGANSANILVQDRITGQINEERMSVYVRLGIRLLYKGFKSGTLEQKRGTYKCLFVEMQI